MIISFMSVPFHQFIPQNPSFGTSLLDNHRMISYEGSASYD